MRYLVLIACISILSYGCGERKGPDVSGVTVNISLKRFDRDFFSIDTTQLPGSLTPLQNKYPVFLNDFLVNILGLEMSPDSPQLALNGIRRFIHDYKPVYDSAQKVFGKPDRFTSEIEDGLKYVKHYFPDYKLPSSLITFVGPIDAFYEASLGGYGDVITSEGLAVGLQLHLGNSFSLYTNEMGRSLYPEYISRKFAPEYIPVNCMKNVIDDLYPEQQNIQTLVEQMVDKGKRLYVLDRIMPDVSDTLKIGYTARQLKGCYDNEGLIWNYFLSNSLVYNNDPAIIKNYIGDSPKTPEFGDGAPGNIGLFVGRQIVRSYMEKNPETDLKSLLAMPAKEVFEKSKYRPR
jgi:hypothetical protein